MYDETAVDCPCPKESCARHGDCCACIRNHLGTDSVTACMFPDNDGDKSLKHFYEKLKERFGE